MWPPIVKTITITIQIQKVDKDQEKQKNKNAKKQKGEKGKMIYDTVRCGTFTCARKSKSK